MSPEPSLYRRSLSRWWSIKRNCDMHHLPRETRLPIMFDKRNYRTCCGAFIDQHHMWCAGNLTSDRGAVLQQGCRHKSNRACRAKKNGAVILNDPDFQPLDRPAS